MAKSALSTIPNVHTYINEWKAKGYTLIGYNTTPTHKSFKHLSNLGPE